MALFQQGLMAPYEPLLPRVGWGCTREMLEEAFSDLQVPWVQDFILRSPPEQDVHALSDPVNISRALSVSMRYKTNPHLSGGLSTGGVHVRLKVPVKSVGDLGVGIGTERSTSEGSARLFFKRKNRFIRFVSNNRKHSALIVRVQPVEGAIGATYFTHTEAGLWVHAVLTFNYQLFLEAIDEKSGKIDFQLLGQSLIQSLVGGVQHSRKPVFRANRLYPHKISNNVGEHLVKAVLCSHANGQAMMSFSVFTDADWNYDYDALGSRSMKAWGIADRLRTIGIPPARNMGMADADVELIEEIARKKYGDEGDPSVDDAIVGTEETTLGQQRPIRIAPFPQIQPLSSEERRYTREEVRKIQKREAAARSYRKKMAEKKKKQFQNRLGIS